VGRFKNEKFANFKRCAILDAAVKEFTEKGIEKASMRAIAAAAGMTTGAIYTLFEGKEDIYAALLHQSLARLNSYVEERTAAAQTPEQAVEASVMAFFEYYIDRLFEVQLGMHSFSGLKHSSLGHDRDEQLNSALTETLDIMGRAIADFSKDLGANEVKAERDAIFSCLMGTLSLAHTGRAESIETNPQIIMKTHLKGLVARLA